MKKSNKILLGGFLTILLLITGVHIALYAKYKSGHYTIYKPGDTDQRTPTQSFPNVSIVTIRNTAVDISFGDTLSVEKGKEKFVRFVQQGDSLVITPRAEEERFRNRGAVKLILPYNASLSAYNSNISFVNGSESAMANPTIYLYNSDAIFAFFSKKIQLGHLKVNASGNSNTTFLDNVQIDNLEIQLKNSSLKDDGSEIGQLTIATDSTSQLILQSKHLLKAKISPIPNNP
ncbi:hypothetical protein LZZ85_12805 [Terrimonas sp. NA20]|uniref:Auto-transporter adhesin head GIN domain-containing protein n=1 Tax=Terrimonas ginsenosidimutans TaxID=2908004 RepID=A0ABS9KS64_9BACT|nr:hypothetical protein [Terrimonas ginsenosidimutans]MCG2615172.1 hypothetical protein [Terrimonas ginsenosidimutans]